MGNNNFFGDIIRASRVLLTNNIAPLISTLPVVVHGTIISDDITFTTTDTILGANAGHQSKTLANTLVGANSGKDITTGDQNTFVGQDSGLGIETGRLNVIVGKNAGNTSASALTGCVLLGQSAGATNTTDNRLMIDNSATPVPLLDGDFANDTLQVNGTATIGKTGGTTVHQINTLGTAPPPGPIVSGFMININGANFTIPLY